MSEESACIFCAITDGHGTASIVKRGELATAFMDIHPMVPGHTLVIPNSHSDGVSKVNDKDGGAVFSMARRIATALKASDIRCEGTNLIIADGRVAGQTVFHTHMHVIPRYRGDDFPMRLDPALRHAPTRETLDEQAATIAGLLEHEPD